MKKVYIIGIGMSEQSLTAEAERAIAQAEVLIGAPRMLKTVCINDREAHEAYKPEEVRTLIDESDCSSFAVLVSGDVGFYSGATALREVLKAYEVCSIAGVSSVVYFCAKLGIPWQDVKLVSAHGEKPVLSGAVRRNLHTFCLTGNVGEIGTELECAGFGELNVQVGENLGYDNERIYQKQVCDLKSSNFPSLTVLLFCNPEFDNKISFGIPDEQFLRTEKVPMTKSEIRAVVLSKLKLSFKQVCYDIGAGTGSVSVEMALSAHEGKVFAIEQKPEAADLIEANCKSFHVGNVSVVRGKAPEAMEALPTPDCVFIGGTSGKIEAIIEKLYARNPDVRIVVTAIAPETAVSALQALERLGFADVEAVQVSTARYKPVGGLHMLLGQNPITIISGGAN